MAAGIWLQMGAVRVKATKWCWMYHRYTLNCPEAQGQHVKTVIECFFLFKVRYCWLNMMYCAWLTGNERGGWAVCHIANVIGNAPRTHTHTQRVTICFSVHSYTHLSFSISLLPTYTLFTHTLPRSLNHSHTPIYALNVWLCGALLQVNNERRGVWPCQKCEKLTQRNQTGAETPQPRGHTVCVCV